MSVSDADRLERARSGDAEALRSLLHLHAGRARSAIHKKIGPQWQSLLSEDDVMQVAYMEAFLHIDQLDAESEAGFSKWLSRIAENVLRDAIKELSRKKRPPPAKQSAGQVEGESYCLLLEELVHTWSTPSRDVARGEARRMLESALAELPSDYGTVVRLYDLEGRSAREVAERIGRSEGAIYMLRSRAHDRLRALLGSPARFFSDSP